MLEVLSNARLSLFHRRLQHQRPTSYEVGMLEVFSNVRLTLSRRRLEHQRPTSYEVGMC
jgi:hypothetical protein